MASQVDPDERQPTVSFTLPISCQVCLGKVKQPVVCPNLHVFCKLCLDVWLKRNSKCPACRADMGPKNPAKHIIGGQVEEELPTRQSCPELRRARFDLLYMEYEDHIERLRKENLILRTENNILVAQVKEGAEQKAKENGSPSKSQQHPNQETSKEGKGSTSNGPSLLVLTKNLQEAQKLYSDIKGDMGRLKQENNKMKDENATLTRENETLRLELAQRSPKKFGRYTVATLETKVSEQEKEIRQLTKALERSDSYIEELEQKLAEMEENTNNNKTSKGEVSKASGGQRFSLTSEKDKRQENSQAASSSFSFRCEKPMPADKARKLLFGKVFVDEVPSATILKHQMNSKSDVSSSTASSSKQASSGASTSGTHLDLAVSSSVDSTQKQQGRQNSLPDSILRSSAIAEGGKAKAEEEMDTGRLDETPRSPKRVHFKDPLPLSKTGDGSSSFDLEMPSPMERSGSSEVSQSQAQSNIGNSSPELRGEKGSAWESSEYDIKVKDLLKKNLQPLKRSGSLSMVTSTQELPHSANKSKKGLHQTKGKGTRSASQTVQDTNDSSHLSVPDMSHSSDFAGLETSRDEDGGRDVKPNLSELDISMTPELSDCLRLMDGAEKRNVGGHPEPVVDSTVRGHQLPPRPSSVPPHLSRPIPSSTLSAGMRHQTAGFAASTQGTMPGWEQQFYSSLHANPYKSPQPSSSSISTHRQDHPDKFQPFSAVGKLEPPSDGGPATSYGSSHYGHHNGVEASAWGDRQTNVTSNPPVSSSTFSFSLNPGLLTSKPSSLQGTGSRTSAALPSKFNFPLSSSSLLMSLSKQSSSSLSSYNALPSTVVPTSFSFNSLMSQPSSSMSVTDQYLPARPSSPSLISSSRAGKFDSGYRNPLPPSLNNSALEWPGGSSPFDKHSVLSAAATASMRALDITDYSRPALHQRHSQQHLITDDDFRAAMQPPSSGYPIDLTHDMSSTSDLDLFSSPRPSARRSSSPSAFQRSPRGWVGPLGGDDLLIHSSGNRRY